MIITQVSQPNTWYLRIPVRVRGNDPQDLADMMLDTRLFPPAATLTCRGAGACSGQQLASELVPVAGEVLIVNIVRVGHLLPLWDKVLTPIMEPLDGADDLQWPGKSLVAVLCHHSEVDEEGVERGHWIAYRKVAPQTWYRVDSARAHIIRENPFDVQGADQTIQLLIFK